MNDDFEKAVRAISIPPKMELVQREFLANEWANNLNLYVKDWAEKEILEMRMKVQANAFEGNRAEGLVKMLQSNYQISKRKAKFLARQETSLLMSKFHQGRYAQVGITRYKWGGAEDERERQDHKILNNKIFSYLSPPVTNRKTGARNNPGEDFGCRCVAIPVIE
jgi:SPP1 gp7 family putative phage head morphogenesis protein